MILEVAVLNVRPGQEMAFEAAYAEWKKRLHHFYDPFPVVEHYVEVSQPAP